MRRLAIFCEGMTEVVFVERLINEIAEKKKVVIEKKRIRGGGKDGKVARSFRTIEATQQVVDQRLYVLLVDCGGDSLVKTRIREEHSNLHNAGYEKVIGLRDVRPDFKKEDLKKLQIGLSYGISTKLVPIVFVLSVLEIEAWFLAEYNHFAAIDPAITADRITALLGFDPRIDDVADREEPARDIELCYQLGGKTYTKADVTSTVDALDFGFLYLKLAERIPQLKLLTDNLDAFMTA
ncbi:MULTISPECIES: hypothetical protein [Paraburkholderia]|uniref:hypothetical protein n=1 Tax=Paraburkholderia TaxID=1822464 RepID=UPI0032184B93